MGLAGIAAACLTVIAAAAPVDVVPFLRANYLAPADGYEGYEPAHRFRALWVEGVRDLVPPDATVGTAPDSTPEVRNRATDERLPWPPSDVPDYSGFVGAVLACAPALKPFARDVIPLEEVRFPRGRVITFVINRAVSGSDTRSDFLSSVVLEIDGRCLWAHELPTTIDVETESEWRRFWDLVHFRGEDYLVTARYGYEWYELEAYRVGAGTLHPVMLERVGGL